MCAPYFKNHFKFEIAIRAPAIANEASQSTNWKSHFTNHNSQLKIYKSQFTTRKSQRLPSLRRALALQAHCRGAQRVGDIFAGGQDLEVQGLDVRQEVQGHFQRGFWVEDQRADNGVVLAELAIVGDQAKRFLADGGHLG